MDVTFDRPLPALTPTQRYHLDVNGYVVIPNVLSEDECEELRDALQRIKRDLRADGRTGPTGKPGPYALKNEPHFVFIGSLLEADPVLTAYATHPRIVGFAEEMIGGEARLTDYIAILNSRDPNGSHDLELAFHTALDIPYASHINNKLYHCSLVKVATNLTDLGPDDGGTVAIAGSHKLDLSVEGIRDCACQDPTLVHQVIAPAGSVVLFFETLVHATGQVRSDRERIMLFGGYGTSMFPYWDGEELSAEFIAQVPDHLKTLIFGKAHWTRGARYRTLSQPADTRQYTLADGWRPATGRC